MIHSFMYIQTHIRQKSPCKMMVENCRLVCRSHSSVVKGQCWAFSSPLCQGLLGSEERIPLPSPQSQYKHRLIPRSVECPCPRRHLRSLGYHVNPRRAWAWLRAIARGAQSQPSRACNLCHVTIITKWLPNMGMLSSASTFLRRCYNAVKAYHTRW